jgi:hypothetical protein
MPPQAATAATASNAATALNFVRRAAGMEGGFPRVADEATHRPATRSPDYLPKNSDTDSIWPRSHRMGCAGVTAHSRACSPKGQIEDPRSKP